MPNDWTLDDGRVIRLLTPVELIGVPTGTVLTDINGNTATKGVDDIDGDTRFGYLAFGFVLPTPPSDAGTSEREMCPDCPHAPHLGTPCAECRRFGGFRGECSHQGAKGRPAAEGPREDVLAETARCEKCGITVVSPTTGRIAGDCPCCRGRMMATKGAWVMAGQPATVPAAPAAETCERETEPVCQFCKRRGEDTVGGISLLSDGSWCCNLPCVDPAAAPAAEGPRDEAWWLAIVDREGDMPFGVGVAPTPSLAEWHRRVAACASRATVKRTGEEWPACDCGLSLLIPPAALPGAEAGTPEGATLRASRRIPVLVDVIAEAMPHSTTRDEVVAAWAALEELGTHAVDLAALTSEVARLTEERDAARDAMVRYSDYYDREVEHNAALIAERRALTSEVRALREDKARLDAIDAQYRSGPDGYLVLAMNGWRIASYRDGYHVAADVFSEPIVDGATLREAIDAARLASPSPTGAP